MLITGARVCLPEKCSNRLTSGGGDGTLQLALVVARDDARRFAYDFKAGEYEIRRTRRKRSLQANNYAWLLCERIAVAVGVTKEDVYRKHIREYGVSTTLTTREEAARAFCADWDARGTGWFTERVDGDSRGNVTLCAYYGSSTYDSTQMARLIDSVITEAEELGITTITPQEMDLLLRQMEER